MLGLWGMPPRLSSTRPNKRDKKNWGPNFTLGPHGHGELTDVRLSEGRCRHTPSLPQISLHHSAVTPVAMNWRFLGESEDLRIRHRRCKCSIKSWGWEQIVRKVQVALRLEMYRPPRIISESIRQSRIRYHIIKVSRRGLGILKERERAFDARAKSNYLPVPMHSSRSGGSASNCVQSWVS